MTNTAIRVVNLAAEPLDLETVHGRSNLDAIDSNMAVQNAVADTNGVLWIDGRDLPIEGRAFDDVDQWYDRLPSGVTTNVNGGVRSLKHCTAGMLFRFVTNSKKLRIRWTPLNEELALDHMPASGASGIDVYRFDSELERWCYVKTGRIKDAREGALDIGWTPGMACLVNLPHYNGIRNFSLGIDAGTAVKRLPPRKSGVEKPVVFYGTSITQGACCSRPGLSFVNRIGRDLDVPVVNLGFAGSGVMEYEMSEHLARIDASCYVLDCLWNMGTRAHPFRVGRNVDDNYEPFIRNLRGKRPGVPIVMVEESDVYCRKKNEKDILIRRLYEKLLAEGWDVAITNRTYAEILDQGRFLFNGKPTEFRIVRLDEALEIVRTVPEFWLDFKYFNPDFAEKVLEECRRAGIEESRLMVATFSRPALGYFLKKHPGIRRIGHISASRAPDGSLRFPSANGDPFVEGVLKYASQLGLFGVNMPVKRQQTSVSDIQTLRQNGLWVSVWFVQNVATAEIYRGAVDAFVTDHVSRVRSPTYVETP